MIYSQLKCYLSLEARAIVEDLKDVGMDEDLAISIVEHAAPDDEVFAPLDREALAND